MTRSQLKKTMLALLLSTACAGFIVACGSDQPATPQGKVVKGPVFGAKVFDSSNPPVLVGTTDANGNFPLTGIAPYSTTGGAYYPVLANGTISIVAAVAPSLKGYNTNPQITPLTTVIANTASPTIQATIIAQLTGNGISLDTDLSSKTAANALAYDLSEAVGAAIQAASNSSAVPATQAANVSGVLSAVANALSAPGFVITTTNESTIASSISTQINNALAAAVVAGTLPATVSTSAQAAVIAVAAGAANLVPGTPSTPTGATGSTGSNGLGF